MTEEKRKYTIGAHTYAAPMVAPGLYLVSTPIGNLADITLRALETLCAVDIIACEDTRVSRVLLDRFFIKASLISYHEHNVQQRGPVLLEALQQGQSVALISDAGTPLISDPGYKLVRKAQEAGIRIVPIPGACAALAALVAAGFATDEFLFVGFLPTKASARQKKLESLRQGGRTLIFYEAPQRLLQTLSAMIEVFGWERKIAFCRELTKIFETITVDSLGALYAALQTQRIRGEIVLVLEGASQESTYAPESVDKLLLELSCKLPAAKVAAEIAKKTGHKKQQLYQRLLVLRGPKSN